MTKLELEPEVSSTNGEADAQELDSKPTVLCLLYTSDAADE